MCSSNMHGPTIGIVPCPPSGRRLVDVLYYAPAATTVFGTCFVYEYNAFLVPLLVYHGVQFLLLV